MGCFKKGYLSGQCRLKSLLFLLIPLLSSSLLCQENLPEVQVSVSSKNNTINEVLDEITLQTGYYFTYSASLIPGKKKIRFQVSDLLLEETLDSLLQEPLLAYRVINRNIVIYERNVALPSPINELIDRLVLKGKVVDHSNGKPLPYATIALFGTSLGSITNQSGEFSFKIPGKLSDPMLVVSYMGYKIRFLPVRYPIENEMVIHLEKEVISLQEVIIRYSDPELLLKEAISRIPRNYLDDPSVMTAFYRESVRRNDHCMIYSEAVLDVSKGSYSNVSNGDQVRIRKARKITDVSSEDTVMLKLRSGIYTSLDLDVVKNRPDFLSDDFLKYYDLDFSDMMTYGDRLVYVISFHQKPNIHDLMFTGQIYLDQENLAILAADFEYNPEMIHREPGLFIISRSPKIHIRPILARYHVEYRPVKERYHVSQVRAEVEMKMRKRRQWIGARYKISLEMAITDVVPGERLRISAIDRVRHNTILSDQPFEFDPAFWGIYNTIEPEASLRESLERIEQSLHEINE